MTPHILKILATTARQWNLPGYAPGFCWEAL